MDSPTVITSPRSLTTGHSTPAQRTRAIAAPVADLHREPSAASERVTQALLHMPAEPLAEERGWARIRLADYAGWIETRHLTAPAAVTARSAVVSAPRTTLYADAAGDQPGHAVYATTILPLLDGTHSGRFLPVALPGGSGAWVAREDVFVRDTTTPFPAAAPDVAIALARQLLGTAYLWGGVTCAGIDCSGLAQLCCRAAGRIIPRDADQQYEGIPYVVERGDLCPGDLIFFAHDGAITHVALMTGPRIYIHAKGSPESRVMVNSLDPEDASYSQRLASLYAGARRPFA